MSKLKQPYIDPIQFPRASPIVNSLASDGSISVIGTVPANIDEVRIIIVPPGGSVPPNPPTNALSIPISGGASQPYTASQVRGARGSLNSAGLPGNTVKVWFCNGGAVVSPHTLEFSAKQPAESQVLVPAQSCLWFAYAPCNAVLSTAWEANIDPYRPMSIGVPSGANYVRITYLGGNWGHQGTASDHNTGAEGEDDDIVETKPDYKNATFNSQNLSPPSTTVRLNRLLALLGGETAPSSATAMLDVGETPQVFATGGATRLFLGFYDGFEWSNNTGAIAVNVEWFDTHP